MYEGLINKYNIKTTFIDTRLDTLKIPKAITT